MKPDCPRHSAFHDAPDISPLSLTPGMSVAEFVDAVGGTCFEARQLRRGARLWQRTLEDDCTVWLGIAGAGIAGGLGGVVIQLIERGFVDVICTTGAQAYHDLHFAFGLPVKAIDPDSGDGDLARRGDTRIYDIGIREEETLEAQDALLRDFVGEVGHEWEGRPIDSPTFMERLGGWVDERAPNPDASFVVAAARAGVPVYWDSTSNHSIALNLARLSLEGHDVNVSAHADILGSAALAYGGGEIGFVELGGGGPKNFIQQTGPTIQQILGIPSYHGASRGLQISTANVREGSLSACTFGEAVTWGKYEADDASRLVQLWGEYSVLFPLLAAYVMERCEPRSSRCLFDHLSEFVSQLKRDLPE